MATTIDISPTTWRKCCPHVVEDFDRCAGVTVCDIVPIMPDDWETTYLTAGMPRVDSSLAEADMMGRACFPKINGMYDWISTTRRNWSQAMMKSSRKQSGQLEYEPFIKMARKGPINNQWWLAVYAGAAEGEEPEGTHSYVVTSLSDNIPNSPNWFHINQQVFFSYKNTDGAGMYGAGIVRDAVLADGDLTIWVEPVPGTEYNQGLPGVGASAGVDRGVLTRGLVNVSDYESFCEQIPALNTRQDAYFWVGTTRYTLCDSELWNDFIARVLRDNKLYREYFHVPDVEYNKQVTADWQSRQVENFFFGKPLSANQTYGLWDTLPEITLDFQGLSIPGDQSCIGRRANPVGVINQLAECERVIDHMGNPLNLSTLFEDIYYMQRVRKDNGVESNVFEIGMNSRYANVFEQGMISYYKSRTQDTLRMTMELGSQKQGPFGFYWRDYVLNYPAGAILRVVTHPFFDDWADAHRRMDVNQETQGNLITMLDWSTIYQAVIDSNSVTNTTGSIQDLAKINQALACTMKTKQTTYRHTSLTFTNVVECPDASLVGHNVGYAVPIHDDPITRVGIGSVPWNEDMAAACAAE